MTRINLISPEHLTNRHLVAEYKEITQFTHNVYKRSASNRGFDDIPKDYTLNTGHCKFFYNKGLYIKKRLISLYKEINRRGFAPDRNILQRRIDQIDNHFNISLMLDYNPSIMDYQIVIDRISQRINEKPHLYKDSDRFFNSVKNYI